MLTLSLRSGIGLGSFTLGTTDPARFFKSLFVRAPGLAFAFSDTAWAYSQQRLKLAGCRLNEALIIAKQNRNIFGCVELKYFAQVPAYATLPCLFCIPCVPCCM